MRAGERWGMRKESSKPMTEMSPGTLIPLDWMVRIAPIAWRSDPAMIAVIPESIREWVAEAAAT